MTITQQQRRVLALLADGLTRAEVADRLGISEHTVIAHIVSARERLNARNTTHAVALFLKMEFAS
jgi:DNA-binding CsgD family transcriptional regulator